ncbi:MAG: endonuclease V [Candidatus Njordarchaeales archaeon]
MIIKYRFEKLKILLEIPDLYSIVYQLLHTIPRGKITTYGELAKALGDIKASRSIGQILAYNPWPDKYPCYKVVRSTGELGKYSYGGKNEKARRLSKEGIIVKNNIIENFNEVLLKSDSFDTVPILSMLQRIQQALTEHIKLTPLDIERIRRIITLDTAYFGSTFPEKSISVGILYDIKLEKILYLSIVVTPIFFPYIPGYLFFREGIPLLLTIDSLISLGGKPDVIIFDGHGLLHPRKAGIATHAGILLSMPTIGVAKKLLYGKLLERKEFLKNGLKVTPIVIDDSILGFRIRKNKSTIYVSPGNMVDPESALEIILRLKWSNHKVPDILYVPHFIATQLRKYATKLFPFIKNIAQKRSSKYSS